MHKKKLFIFFSIFVLITVVVVFIPEDYAVGQQACLGIAQKPAGIDGWYLGQMTLDTNIGTCYGFVWDAA